MRHGPVVLGLIAGLAACGEPTQLYIAHNTVVGLDAAVDTNRQAGRLLFGYDRQFIALAPKAVPHKKDLEEPDPVCDEPVSADAACREAMAALSCSEVEVRGIFLTRFKDNLATGTAATKAASTIKTTAERLSRGEATAKEYETLAAIFDCWQRQETAEQSRVP
jgi:hypothetical protein